MGRPTLVVAIEGDPTGGVAAFATEADAAKSFAAQMEAITKSIEVGFDNVGKKIESVSSAQRTHASNTGAQLSSIQAGLADVGKQFDKAFDVGALLGDAASNVLTLIGPLALVEGAIHLVETAWDGLVELSKEGITKGDEIRDLSLSFSVMEGKVHGAGEALDYFEKHADDTRDTAEKLAGTFRKLESLATRRGFSVPEQENITLMLSQLATIRGASLEDMQSGWQRLLSGMPTAGRNPLLAALGISKGDVDHLGFNLVLEKMKEVSSHFPEFGQSFQSEMEKIKEDVVVNVAEGFNSARGNAKTGMDAIRAAVNDPELRSDLRSLGGEIAHIFAVAGDTAKLRQDLFTIPNLIRSDLESGGSTLSLIANMLENAREANAQRMVDQHSRGQQTAIDAGVQALRSRYIDPDTVGLQGLERGYFEKSIGDAQSSMSKDQFKAFLQEISKAAKDGVVTLAEFTKAEQTAMAPPPPSATPNHGLVDPTRA
ncbi:MAG TPA: hypothetical protein VHU41_20320, partial [Thermoanaerobaculia bacterium]|nr:hypothetical protein [Thermoanaerobaculia bacterium]